MFQFLLVAVNAKYIHSNPAIYSLRAYAGEELGTHVELAEYTINQPMDQILRCIYGRKPDAIGFSCYIWNWRLVRELLGEIPKLLPDAKLWLGGPEVSYDADVILKEYPQLTGIMVGEGEETFRQLLTYYVSGEAEAKQPAGNEQEDATGKAEGSGLENIPGLCLPTGYTPYRALTDLSQVPFLYEDLTPFDNRILYYETSRGCPFRCSYCLSSIDKQVRIRDINMVKKELQFFLDHKVRQVKFIDRTFNCSHAHTMAVWTYLLEHDNGVTNFHFEITADLLRQDEIELLSRFRPGLAQLEIGVQSVNSETLQAIHRVMDVERLERTVKAIRQGGNVHLHLDLIAGLPYEDYESFGASFNRVYRMSPHQLQLGFLKVLKGSEMWERAQEYGIRYLEQPPYEVLYTKWLSYGEVLELKRVEEMVEIYYNSGQFTHTLSFLEKAFSTPFTLYQSLADFYEEKGFFTASPARSHRYDALLSFALQYDGAQEEIYRELLTYDMYLRENLKSRPDFAKSQEGSRETVREFYQKEQQERCYLPDYREYDWKQMSKMTHLEAFAYPVWDEARMADCYGHPERKCAQDTYVLFDYRNRNPLTWEATVQVILPKGKEAGQQRIQYR